MLWTSTTDAILLNNILIIFMFAVRQREGYKNRRDNT
jgi:hypothetical protein